MVIGNGNIKDLFDYFAKQWNVDNITSSHYKRLILIKIGLHIQNFKNWFDEW
jgi:hypothetical protein|uniref:Uncharacterized protein n=1 Tax=viral metagenome TaxID=1070528 RepID=A0A6C0IUU9_9ZZZZ